MKAFALTTIDNPFDPFDEFEQWYNYDLSKGYDCCGYLDRIARTSDQLSDEENERQIERAIDEIISYDLSNTYRKVSKEVD